MRHQIEQSLGIKAYDAYTDLPKSQALVYLMNVLLKMACTFVKICLFLKLSTLIRKKYFPPGSFGELVFTTITKRVCQ